MSEGVGSVDPSAHRSQAFRFGTILRIRDHAKALVLIFLAVVAYSGCTAPAARSQAAQSVIAPTVTLPSSTPAVHAPPVGLAEKWIEVELAAQMLRLREGTRTLAEYPCATGVGISPETTTNPGVHTIQQMIEGPIENVPGVYVSHILIYDLTAGAGIHSMPMDKNGLILDSTLGRPATAGCVRVGEAAAVFKFARVGTTIWIH